MLELFPSSIFLDQRVNCPIVNRASPQCSFMHAFFEIKRAGSRQGLCTLKDCKLCFFQFSGTLVQYLFFMMTKPFNCVKSIYDCFNLAALVAYFPYIRSPRHSINSQKTDKKSRNRCVLHVKILYNYAQLPILGSMKNYFSTNLQMGNLKVFVPWLESLTEI